MRLEITRRSDLATRSLLELARLGRRAKSSELADLVGASRPVVSTILNRLRDKGVLGYNREYVCVRGIEEIAKLIDS